MTIIRLSGSQLHAARVLLGLSREEVAKRAGLCRHSIHKWETSSHAIPGVMYSHLCRAIDVLEGEGARFSGDDAAAPPRNVMNARGLAGFRFGEVREVSTF